MTTMLIRELKTASEVIDALGGTAAVGRLTNRKDQAVSNWRAAGRLPSELYLIMKAALADAGCSAPSMLWSIRAPVEQAASA